MIIPVNIVFEDELSSFCLSKLIEEFDGKYVIGHSYNGHGFGYIKRNLNGFNEAAISTTFIVLTDLDKYECPVSLIRDWLAKPKQPNLIIRIAVREVESWILADIEGYSKYIGVSASNFTETPEELPDPKQKLIQLTRRSRKRAIREDIVPINDKASIGPNYNGRLMEFVIDHWDIKNAMSRSESLRRAHYCLKDFNYTTP